MGNWLQKALGRPESSSDRPVPVPFEMICLCGHALTGTRQERAKRMICSECGRAQFILPLNQYPVSEWKYFGGQQTQESPESTDEMPAREARAATSGSSAEIRKPFVAPKKKPRPANEDADQIRVLDDEPQDTPRPTSNRRRAARLDAIEMAPRERSSSRGKVLMLLCLLSAVVVTSVVWAIVKHRRESAEIRYKQASDAGHLAFEKGDFGKARSEYEDALKAAQTLGLSPSQRESVETRRLHANAILTLVDVELFDLLSVPAADVAGKSVIVQTTIVAHEIQSGAGTSIEWDLLGATKPVRLRGVDEIHSIAKKAGLTEVLIAAEIERIEAIDGGAVHVVHFRKRGTFFWQDFESLKRMGLCPPTDEETTHNYRQLCSRQAAAMRGESVPVVTQAESGAAKAGMP